MPLTSVAVAPIEAGGGPAWLALVGVFAGAPQLWRVTVGAGAGAPELALRALLTPSAGSRSTDVALAPRAALACTASGTMRVWTLSDEERAGDGAAAELAPWATFDGVSEWVTRGFVCALSHDAGAKAAAPLAHSCTWDRALQIWDLSSCASSGPVSTLRLDRSPVALAMPAAWRVDGAAPASKRVPVVLGDDEGGVHFLEMWWSEAELEPGET